MNSTDPNAAIVLFSGGQDSTVCIVWALHRFERVETVGFDYGQRHRVELDVRGRVRERISAMRAPWATRLGEDYMVEIPALAALSESALTRDVAIAVGESGLPTRSCPGAISCSSRWPALSPTDCALFRRAGFDGLSCLGTRSIRTGRDHRFRLRPASSGEARRPGARARAHQHDAPAMGNSSG